MNDQRRAAGPVATRPPSIPTQRVPADDETFIDLSAPPRPAARSGRRPFGVMIAGAVAVFLAGGVGYAALRPAPVVPPAKPTAVAPPAVAPAEPSTTVEVPPAPLPSRVGLPMEAADRVRQSPVAR